MSKKAIARMRERYLSAQRMVRCGTDPNRCEAWQIIAVHRKRQLDAMIKMKENPLV